MEEILITILQVTFEFLLEILSYWPFEWSPDGLTGVNR